MILTAGKLNAEHLFGGNASGKKFANMQMGTSNTPETPADTAITGAVTKPFTNIEYLAGNLVKFTAQLDAGDAPMAVNELGLVNDDGVLVYRKVFGSPQNKVAGLAMIFTYTIKVI